MQFRLACVFWGYLLLCFSPKFLTACHFFYQSYIIATAINGPRFCLPRIYIWTFQGLTCVEWHTYSTFVSTVLYFLTLQTLKNFSLLCDLFIPHALKCNSTHQQANVFINVFVITLKFHVHGQILLFWAFKCLSCLPKCLRSQQACLYNYLLIRSFGIPQCTLPNLNVIAIAARLYIKYESEE